MIIKLTYFYNQSSLVVIMCFYYNFSTSLLPYFMNEESNVHVAFLLFLLWKRPRIIRISSNDFQHSQFTRCSFDQNKMTNKHSRIYICTYMCNKIRNFTSYKVEINLLDCTVSKYNICITCPFSSRSVMCFALLNYTVR